MDERQAAAWEHHSQAQDNIVDHRPFQRFGVSQVQDAFVERYPGADREDQNGDHKAPKIDFFPMTKGKASGRRLSGLSQAEEEENLVAGVNN